MHVGDVHLKRSYNGRKPGTSSCVLQVGDVIYIEANSGAVKRQGRSDAFATEFDLEAEEYVPLPKGDVHKRKEVIQVSS